MVRSDSEKKAALSLLKANGWNYKRTADELGIPLTTLRRWGKQEKEQNTEGEPSATDKALADELRSLCSKIVRILLRRERLEDASIRDLGVLLGIILDKLPNLAGARYAEDGQLAALVAAIREGSAQ